MKGNLWDVILLQTTDWMLMYCTFSTTNIPFSLPQEQHIVSWWCQHQSRWISNHQMETVSLIPSLTLSDGVKPQKQYPELSTQYLWNLMNLYNKVFYHLNLVDGVSLWLNWIDFDLLCHSKYIRILLLNIHENSFGLCFHRSVGWECLEQDLHISLSLS